MSDWIPLLVLLFFVAIAVGCIGAVIAFISIRSLSRRVEHLERERAALRGPLEKSAPLAPATTAPRVADVPPSAPPPVPQRSEWASPSPPAAAPPPQVSATFAPQPAPRAAELALEKPAAKPATPVQRFEWERWLGVRGAAVLGGIVVAIAGFLFLQYSIERGLLKPEVRVVIAAIAGLACFVGSVPLRKRGYVIVADSISGAGAVLLYASAWAAHVVYGMISFPPAFAAMVVVTGACAFLARRHGSLVIAVLGLAGGFATPIALSSGQDRPIALFGYVILLDFAFLFVAQKRRWPSLALLALAGTVVIQARWIFWRMEPHDLPIGLAVLASFALFFALFVARLAAPERMRFGAAQVGALVLPFVFAMYFAQDRTLGEHVWPLLTLAGVLALASAWIARSSVFAWLPIGSASGAVALALTWTGTHEFDMTAARAQELVACGFGLALLHAIISELAARRPKSVEQARGAHAAALIIALGFQLIAFYAVSRPYDVGVRPWIGSTALLALIAYRQVGLGLPMPAALFSSCLVGLTGFVWMAKHGRSELMPAPVAWSGLLGLIGAALLYAAWLLRGRGSRLPYWGVIGFTLPVTLGLLALLERFGDSVPIYVALASILGLQAALAATAARSSPMYFVAVVTTMLVTFLVSTDARRLASKPEFVPTFACIAVAATLFALWPLLRTTPWIDRANAWRIAALSLLPQFFLVRELFTARWSSAPIFALAFAFEIVAGAAAVWLFVRRASEDRAQRVGRIWFSCAAILFAAMIVPLQIDREPFAITLALFAAGIALFHVRIDARPLAWVAVAALGVALLRLDVWGAFESWPHSPVRLWNWVGYTHLLPGIAAVVTATCLRRAGAVVPAAFTGILAVLFVFTWINLEIANAFTSQARFTLRYEHTQARDLIVSIAWIVYAIALLLVGVSKQRGALRWASLVLFLLTIGKVFLFDLGHLQGLHRAASVAGLGVSLLLVSVLYQRFVFRRPAPGS